MRPNWLRIKLSTGNNFNEIKGILRENRLHTVCEEALCPNIGECFEQRTATFLILGTPAHTMRILCREEGKSLRGRRRGTSSNRRGRQKMNLQYVVITSVTRDDLTDGGVSLRTDNSMYP